MLALHGSIGVWVGVWDSFVYTGFGRLWCATPEPLNLNVCSDTGNEFRNFVWVVLGAALAFITGTLLCNGNVEAPPLHSRAYAFWVERSQRSRSWTYMWTALAYVAQVMMTCGMYELFDNVKPFTPFRDVVFVVVGLLGYNGVVVWYVYWPRGSAKLNPRQNVEEDGALLHRSNSRRALLVKFVSACVAIFSYVFQSMLWLGCDNLLEVWAFENDATLFGTHNRRGWHQIVYMVAGLVILFLSGKWRYVSCMEDREYQPTPSLAGIMKEYFLEMFGFFGYFVHLSGFWFLLDEDSGWDSSIFRNAALILVFYIPLWASGTLFNDAGIDEEDIEPVGLYKWCDKSREEGFEVLDNVLGDAFDGV